MEIRQLEYFVTSADEKSFYKASEKLFISQPAISKSISLLEKELKVKLFTRTNKGLSLTLHGEKLYCSAKNILNQIDIIKTENLDNNYKTFNIASYQSNFISEILSNFHINKNHSFQINYREGSVQDIIDLVSNNVSDFGIVYIHPSQQTALQHILSHKQLEFIPLKTSELCIYVGKKNSLFDSNSSISLDELSTLNFIGGIRDFLSVEHNFDYENLNEIKISKSNILTKTNSFNFISTLLNSTDLCYLGLNNEINYYGSKLSIDASEKTVILGYIKSKSSLLNTLSLEFISYLSKSL